MSSLRNHPAVGALRGTPAWIPVRSLWRLFLTLLSMVGVRQPDKQLEADAQDYWTSEALQAPNQSHWRGDGGLSDDQFFAMGEANAERFRCFARALQFPTENLTILEWGCGGGTNLRALAGSADHLIGVDLNTDSLERTREEVRAAGHTSYTPVLIDGTAPESVLEQLDEPIDVFLCLNVMELIPTPEYGVRLLHIARQLLRPGGMALVQIRYDTGRRYTASRRAFYRLDVATMTTYRIDAFWQRCDQVGLTPRLLSLSPEEDVIGDRYAYYALTRQ